MVRTAPILAAGGLMLASLTTPVRAQEPEPPTALLEVQVATPATPDAADLAERRRLAEQFVELSVTEPMRKSTAAMVEGLLEANTGFTPEQAAWWRHQLPQTLVDISESIAEAVTPHYADRLTREELEALIAFYGTPAGREILRKTTEIGFELGETVMLTAAEGMQALTIKFCGEFDCAAMVAPGVSASKF